MIRAIAHDNHGLPIVLLGLDDENLLRLTSDMPIDVNLARLDPDGERTELPDIRVVLFYASEEAAQALYERYQPAEEGDE